MSDEKENEGRGDNQAAIKRNLSCYDEGRSRPKADNINWLILLGCNRPFRFNINPEDPVSANGDGSDIQAHIMVGASQS